MHHMDIRYIKGKNGVVDNENSFKIQCKFIGQNLEDSLPFPGIQLDALSAPPHRMD